MNDTERAIPASCVACGQLVFARGINTHYYHRHKRFFRLRDSGGYFAIVLVGGGRYTAEQVGTVEPEFAREFLNHLNSKPKTVQSLDVIKRLLAMPGTDIRIGG